MTGAPGRLLESLRAFRQVFANADLRRLQLAWAGSMLGSWAYGIALTVFAFQQDGAFAVGIVALLRFSIAAVAAPISGLLGDRYRRSRVMIGSDLVRALAMAAMAVALLAGLPAVVVYALSVLVTVASTAFRPAQAALLPSLARTPGELTAANVTSSTIEAVGIFAGPALGGLLFAATGAEVVFLATAATFLWSALLIARLTAAPRHESVRIPIRRLGGEVLLGFRTILRDPGLRLLVGLFAAQTFVDGALGVLIVVLALDVLDLGASGVGALNSVGGIGGILGAVVAAALVGRARLASDFGLGLLLWGAPLVLIGLWPSAAAALVLLAIVGIGNTLVDVAGDTLLQRTAPDEVLARVFGVLESLVLAAVGIGAIVAPLLVSTLGARGALVTIGAVLPVLAALAWRRLAAIDAAAPVPERGLELLRSIAIFAPLPEATLEQLASRLTRARFAPGAEIVREGEPGARFYVIGEGTVEVRADGRAVRTLAAGEYFGEIALLRDVPRTATVTASEAVELHALERDDFVAAVTGHAASAEAADSVIASRVGPVRAGVAPI